MSDGVPDEKNSDDANLILPLMSFPKPDSEEEKETFTTAVRGVTKAFGGLKTPEGLKTPPDLKRRSPAPFEEDEDGDLLIPVLGETLSFCKTPLRETTQRVWVETAIKLPYGHDLNGEVNTFDNVAGRGIVTVKDHQFPQILGRNFHVFWNDIHHANTEVRPKSLRRGEKVTFQIGGATEDNCEMAIKVRTTLHSCLKPEPEDLPVNTKMKGVVVWFGPCPIGFIKCIDDDFPVCKGREFFLHYSAIYAPPPGWNGQEKWYKNVEQDQEVQFDLCFDNGSSAWKCNSKVGGGNACGKRNQSANLKCTKCGASKPANRFKCLEVTGPDGGYIEAHKPDKTQLPASQGRRNSGRGFHGEWHGPASAYPGMMEGHMPHMGGMPPYGYPGVPPMGWGPPPYGYDYPRRNSFPGSM